MHNDIWILIAALVAAFILSVLLGRLIRIRYIAPLKPGWKKWLCLAALRAMLYTPALTIGEHGVVILPAVFALIFGAVPFWLYTLPLPLLVFAVSVVVSRRQSQTVSVH